MSANVKPPINLVLFGAAGLIGYRHANLVNAHPEFVLKAIVDPNPQAAETAKSLGAEWHEDASAFWSVAASLDAAIIATPNHTHADLSIKCLENGLACLVEKPLATNIEEAKLIAKCAEETRNPVLVGHHRRHHEATKIAADAIKRGVLGDIVGAQVTWTLRKPDDYFAKGEWRKTATGGPVWINFVHEIDMLLALLGPVDEVSAMTTNKVRNAGVEDASAIMLRMRSGVLVSAFLSDATPTPWHFEGASGENPNIAATGQDGTRIFGTRKALSFPSLTLWRHDNEIDGNWANPIDKALLGDKGNMSGEVALKNQLDHFAAVTRREENPIVSAADGLHTVAVTEAILRSAKTGKTVSIEVL